MRIGSFRPMVRPDLKARSERSGLLWRFLREEDGAAMVEAAFVTIPYLYIVFAIFEVALIILVQSLMNHGVADVSRMLRTRQVTAATHTPDTFRNLLCARPYMGLFNCNELRIDVQQVATFGNPPVPVDPQSQGLAMDNQIFAPGPSRSINIMRVYYQWPVVFNRMQAFLDDNFNGKGPILVSTEAYVTE